MIVSKEHLKIVANAIDKNNEMHQLNALFVDVKRKKVIATDAKHMVIVSKTIEMEKPQQEESFMVAGSLVRTALKGWGAKYFMLEPNAITALSGFDKEDILFKISHPTKIVGKYPDYTKIIPKKMAKTIPFIQPSQIAGIFAIEKIHINDKYIPKLESGFCKITSYTSPVIVINEDQSVQVVIMPVIDQFHNMKIRRSKGQQPCKN